MTAKQFMDAAGEQPTTATALKAKIELLHVEIAKLEALIADQQTEFRAVHIGRDQAERRLADLLRMTADLMSAREAVARLSGELSALRSIRSLRPWWWRLLAG
jgi:predicted RNase H-like nuclease (RuvC/YqgF family)